MNWIMIEQKWQEMAQRLQGAQTGNAKVAPRETTKAPERTSSTESIDSSTLV